MLLLASSPASSPASSALSFIPCADNQGFGCTTVSVPVDRGGVVLSEKTIVVTSPSDHVVYVYRGPSRATYSCNPDCSARVNLGDDPEVFEKILAETVTRSNQAMSAGGNFYGTTFAGGNPTSGVVYRLARLGNGWILSPVFADISIDMTEEELQISHSTPNGWLQPAQ